MRQLFSFVAASSAAVVLAACGGGGGAVKGSGLVAIQTGASLPATPTGQPFSIGIDATFPNPPGAFYVTGGALPRGTTLDTFTGQISGYPRDVGHFTFEIAARDGVEGKLPPGRDASYAEDRRTFAIDVTRGAVQILPQLPPTAQYRGPYSYQIDAAGGTPPYTFEQTGGTLPAGLKVSSSGVIADFPTRADQHPYHVDVTVTDAVGQQHTRTLDVDVVVLPLFIKTSNLPDASEGFPYSAPLELSSTGGGSPWTWTQVPPVAGEVLLSTINLQVEPAGKVSSVLPSGAPAAGIYKFTVQVKDEADQVATRQLTLKVMTSPVLSSISPKVALAVGPFTATGLKFLPGATLVFNPAGGATGAKTITPTWVNATTLTFAAPPTLSTAGPVTVRVVNPDGGAYDLPNAMLYSAANISFGAKGFIPDALSSFGLDCADVTKDGLADIIHCGYGGFKPFSSYALTSSAGGLHYLKNNGGLSFTALTLSSTNYTACKFVDVDTDGDLDIVALRNGGIDTWLNNGTGTFTTGPTSSVTAPSSGVTSDLAVGFVNADAIPDIVYGAGGVIYGGSVYVALGNGTGGFTVNASAVSSMGSFYGINSVACVKVDGDNIDDLVVGPSYYSSPPPFMIRMLMSSSGTFSGAWTASAATTKYYGGTQCVRAGNFLNQPNSVVVSTAQDPPDSGAGGGAELAIFSGSNLVTKTNLTIGTGMSKNIGVGDFDFDGVTDFAISHKNGPAGGTSSPTGGTCDLVYVYKGTSGNLSTTLNLQSGAPTITFANSGRVAVGDLDGDGRPDLLVTTSFWATDNQQSTYYQRGESADGNQQGIVFYLNTSL